MTHFLEEHALGASEGVPPKEKSKQASKAKACNDIPPLSISSKLELNHRRQENLKQQMKISKAQLNWQKSLPQTQHLATFQFRMHLIAYMQALICLSQINWQPLHLSRQVKLHVILRIWKYPEHTSLNVTKSVHFLQQKYTGIQSNCPRVSLLVFI